MKILLVDDEEDIRKIGRLSLEAVGKFDTAVAASAMQAIELARSEQPDVILMDVMMPGIDGLQAIAELRRSEDLRRIPVIFMTAKVQSEELEHYIASGAIGVIQKPFDPMTLAEQVRRILRER